MTYSIQNVKKAREMRISGGTLSEISKEIKISKSTLSYWLKDIILNKEQQSEVAHRIKNKMSRGRLNSSIILRAKRMFKEKKIYEDAEKEFKHLNADSFFMNGLGLYLMSGTKKGSSFQFSSSDPLIISFMTKWAKKYLGVDQVLIKKRNYDGYLRIDISRVDVLRRVIAWQKLLIKYYGSL